MKWQKLVWMLGAAALALGAGVVGFAMRGASPAAPETTEGVGSTSGADPVQGAPDCGENEDAPGGTGEAAPSEPAGEPAATGPAPARKSAAWAYEASAMLHTVDEAANERFERLLASGNPKDRVTAWDMVVQTSRERTERVARKAIAERNPYLAAVAANLRVRRPPARTSTRSCPSHSTGRCLPERARPSRRRCVRP